MTSSFIIVRVGKAACALALLIAIAVMTLCHCGTCAVNSTDSAPASKRGAEGMVKFLFFDNRELESISGFRRVLETPSKHPSNPLFIANRPWEYGNMQLYGSVVKASGKPFQLWYSVIIPDWKMRLAYAESDDGIKWRKPTLDFCEIAGMKTNIVFDRNPHGPAVIYDDTDPRKDWRYKMICGASPSGEVYTFRSADGIHWQSVMDSPAIQTNPDSPMSLARIPGGYATTHRLEPYGRRVFRSESADFIHWTKPHMIIDSDPGDPPQTQYYGMGMTSYGGYEIGTLWLFHTDPSEPGGKRRGYQEPELVYARSGYAWHRAAQGQPFIPHGEKGSWEQGNLQPASAPVFLEDEIRYYYVGTTAFHDREWELTPQKAGLGFASLRPDRFVGLAAGEEPGQMRTCEISMPSPHLYVNASVRPGGYVKVELLYPNNEPIKGFSGSDCVPITGDGIALRVSWKSSSVSPRRHVRLRVTAKEATIYSIFSCAPDRVQTYWDFHLPMP